MPFVLTVDQVTSRRQPDLIDEALSRLQSVATVRPFTRTVGDEFQGLLDDPASVLDAILTLMRGDDWHIGLGIGGVEEPIPADVRAARGPAFLAARTAVEAAKSDPDHVRILAEPPAEEEAGDADVVLHLLAAVQDRRSPSGWDAVDLSASGRTQAEVAAELKITRQAVSQRLQAANWAVEVAARPVLTRMLARAETVAASEVTS